MKSIVKQFLSYRYHHPRRLFSTNVVTGHPRRLFSTNEVTGSSTSDGEDDDDNVKEENSEDNDKHLKKISELEEEDKDKELIKIEKEIQSLEQELLDLAKFNKQKETLLTNSTKSITDSWFFDVLYIRWKKLQGIRAQPSLDCISSFQEWNKKVDDADKCQS